MTGATHMLARGRTTILPSIVPPHPPRRQGALCREESASARAQPTKCTLDHTHAQTHT